jgi:hypothetical protein
VLLAVGAVYGPTLRHGFVWDDSLYVTRNAFVADPANLRLFLEPSFWLEDQRLLNGSRPLVLASLLVDRALWGSWAGGYHLTNLVLHAANALLTWGLALTLGLRGPAALAAGLLFAAHPAATEAVCAVSFRTDLLAALLSLSAAAALLAAARRGRAAGAALSGLGALAHLAGLLAKESGALTPAAALGARRAEWSRGRAAAAAALLLAAAAAFAAYHAPRFRYALTPAPPAAPALAADPLWAPAAKPYLYPPSPPPWQRLYEDPSARAATMLAEWGRLLTLVVRPTGLTVDRAPTVKTSFADRAVLFGAALLAALALAAWRAPAPAAAAGAAWALAAWVPVSGLAPLYNPVAERYLYLLLPGAAWLAAALLERIGSLAGEEAPKTVLTVTLALAVPLGTLAARRAAVWESDAALFFAPAGSPQSPRAAYNRGLLRLKAGRADLAEAEWVAAVTRHPGFAEAWGMLGGLYERSGDPDRARQAYANGAAQASPSPVPLFVFARFLERRGERAAAAAVHRAALARDPGFTPAAEALKGLKR